MIDIIDNNEEDSYDVEVKKIPTTPIICGQNYITLFKGFAKFVGYKYYSNLGKLEVDGEFSKHFDWAYKIQLMDTTDRRLPIIYIVAGKNALGVGFYLTDYKKVENYISEFDK